METVEIWSAILMLVVLGKCWRLAPAFAVIQFVQFGEYPFLLGLRWWGDPWVAWRVWHGLNQVNIVLSLIAAMTCLRRLHPFNVAAILLLSQCMLKVAKYAGIDTNHEFTLDALYWTCKWIDVAVNLAVVGACYSFGRKEA